jgi:hypothetical protein
MVSIPASRVSVAETLIDEARQRPPFAESDVRHSRRLTCNSRDRANHLTASSPVRHIRPIFPEYYGDAR